jgi:hypothetical protein
MYLDCENYSLLKNDPRWVYEPLFTPKEIACRITNRVHVWLPTMNRLQSLRRIYGKRIAIISGFRTYGNGAHPMGRAFDIYAADAREQDLPQLLTLAREVGFTRCGIHLSTKRWRLHLDDITPQDGGSFGTRSDGHLFCWTYPDTP